MPPPVVSKVKAKMDIDNVFEYHAPTAEKLVRYKAVREAAKHFARAVQDNAPAGADQSAALRKIREAVMTANAAIALDGKL